MELKHNIPQLDEKLRDEPSNIDVLYERANAYHKILKEAIPTLHSLEKKVEGHKAQGHDLRTLLIDVHERREAEDYPERNLDEFTEKDGTELEIVRDFMRLSSFHEQLVKLGRTSISDLETIINLCGDAKAYFFKGLVRVDLGEIDKAMKDFQKAHELDSKYPIPQVYEK